MFGGPSLFPAPVKTGVNPRTPPHHSGPSWLVILGISLLVIVCACSRGGRSDAHANAAAGSSPGGGAVPAAEGLRALLRPVVEEARASLGDSLVPPWGPFEPVIDSAADALLPAVNSAPDDSSKVALLKRCVYGDWGIAFDANQDDVRSLFPHTVVARKRGSCLGVSLLFLLLGERLSLPLHGVLLPGHFFVRYHDGSVRINLEPNRGGFMYTDGRYREKYGVADGSWYDLRDLTPREVIAVVNYNLGNMLRLRQELPRAARCYERAARNLSGFAEAYGNLGIVDDAMGKSREAVDALMTARSLRPELPNLHRNLGALYLKLGEWAAAGDVYREGLREAPGDADLLYGKAVASFSLGRYDTAGAAAGEALAARPEFAQARTLLREIEARHEARER